MRYRHLVIGTGSIGKRVAGILVDLDKTVIVHDTDIDRAQMVGESVGALPVNSLELDTDTIEAAYICTPPVSHLALARWAVSHGMHVFIEKPVSHSTNGLVELQEDVRLHGVTCMVSSNWCYDEIVKAVKRDIDNGVFGHVLALSFTFGYYLPSWRPHVDWRETYSAHKSLGGGIVLDAIHEFDLAYFMAGPFAQSHGTSSCIGLEGMEAETTADGHILHDSGIVSHIHVDCLSRHYRRSIEVHGSEKSRRYPLVPNDDMYIRQIEDFFDRITCAPQLQSLRDAQHVLEHALTWRPKR